MSYNRPSDKTATNACRTVISSNIHDLRDPSLVKLAITSDFMIAYIIGVHYRSKRVYTAQTRRAEMERVLQLARAVLSCYPSIAILLLECLELARLRSEALSARSTSEVNAALIRTPQPRLLRENKQPPPPPTSRTHDLGAQPFSRSDGTHPRPTHGSSYR